MVSINWTIKSISKMKRFLIFAISIMAFIPSFSQDSKVKRPDSYNYQRGVEAIQKENSEEALEYLNRNQR